MKISTTELIMVLAVVVIIFGPTQIPKLTKMFGQSVKSFREGIGDDDGDDKKVAQDVSKKEE
ncbi:MAG: twin-arginine translocase TatA/TatE family subunit [Clostridiales bacterium]|nr:twin-arginine translocase TatA/TatE family subunit [Clostridiales bacterium]